MRLLLDTHTFLWFVAGSSSLSPTARSLIEDTSNQPLLSVASIWEMVIKLSLGKLSLAQPLDVFVTEQMARNGINPLSIELSHVLSVATLPFHDHRDPFDRLLVAQAMVEQIPLASADEQFDQYPTNRLW
jgi:PIN domain nuclease of toxin-antitoxin system